MTFKQAFKVMGYMTLSTVGLVIYLAATDDTQYDCEVSDTDGKKYCTPVVTEQEKREAEYRACKDKRLKDYTFGKESFRQNLKDPSSFDQIGFPRKFADSYQITYSAINSYGGRLESTHDIAVTNCQYE